MPSSTLCRLCVSESTELLDMCKLYYGETPAITYVVEVLDIKMDRESSDTSNTLVMCSDCNAALNDFHSFCRMVREAQQRYKQLQVPADIEPHSAFTKEYSFVGKIEYMGDECLIEETLRGEDSESEIDYRSIPSMENSCKKFSKINKMVNTENDQKIVVPLSLALDDILKTKSSKYKIEENCEAIILKSHSECKSLLDVDPDDKPIAVLLREESTQKAIKSQERNKSMSSKSKKISKKSKATSSNGVKRKKSLRSEKATKIVLSKYKVEEIFKDGSWQLSLEQKEEIFRLYIDMKCSQCGSVFSTYPQLDDHCISQHETHAVVNCDKLPISSYDVMERHILYKHILNCKMPRVRARVPCNVCNKLIIDCHMRQHLSSHLPHDKREFQCEQCHAGFGTKSALKSHIVLNHEATQVPCNECGKMFRNIYHVTQHKKRVHGPSDNVHLCPECGKKYKDFTMFTNHVKEHYGIVDRVKCAVCEVIIKRACLSKHMRIHDIKNQKQCPHCPYKGFQIREHVKRAHEKLKPHACAFCPKKFYNEKGLKDHMSSCHTGIPEYSCEFCGATFMSSGNCHSHRKKMHPTHWALQKLEKAKKLDADNIPVCDASTLLRNKHFLHGEKAEQVIKDLQNRKKKTKT